MLQIGGMAQNENFNQIRGVAVIQSILWPDPSLGGFRSPFQRGDKERPLRLSLHVQSLKSLSEAENAAYEAIRELGEITVNLF